MLPVNLGAFIRPPFFGDFQNKRFSALNCGWLPTGFIFLPQKCTSWYQYHPAPKCTGTTLGSEGVSTNYMLYSCYYSLSADHISRCIFCGRALRSPDWRSHSAEWYRFWYALRASEPARWAYLFLWPLSPEFSGICVGVHALYWILHQGGLRNVLHQRSSTGLKVLLC